VIHAEEAKESSQCADIVLETCSIQPCAGLGDIRFDIAGPNGSQGNACFFQVLEKIFRGPAMAANRGGSESANFAEVIRILVAQSRCLSCCWMAVIHEQAVGEQISFQRVDGSSTAGVLLLQGLTAIVENGVVELRDLIYASAA
jgi:hypothetical protein